MEMEVAILPLLAHPAHPEVDVTGPVAAANNVVVHPRHPELSTPIGVGQCSKLSSQTLLFSPQPT